MAFENDLTEFFNNAEFAESITHNGEQKDVMFFDVREEFDNIYINHTYFTIPASILGDMVRGDEINRANTIYKVKSITDHNSDKSIKVVELDLIRESI